MGLSDPRPGSLTLTSLHSVVHDFLFFFRSGINRSDPMSAAAYGSGLRALSADSTKKNCSHPLTSCCRGVKCSGFPSWEEGKNILKKFKKNWSLRPEAWLLDID